MMQRKIIILCAALSLAGCDKVQLPDWLDKAPSPQQTILAACGAIDTALRILTAHVGKLSDDQIDLVSDVDATARPICTNPNPPETYAEVVLDLVTKIAVIQSSVIEGQ